jgi:hypothetical protein
VKLLLDFRSAAGSFDFVAAGFKPAILPLNLFLYFACGFVCELVFRRARKKAGARKGRRYATKGVTPTSQQS